jgi:creatinine amidohydrolase/Fe(II)-dependent formamide hydrolase-like protein
VVTNLAASLVGSNLRTIVLLNNHGGKGEQWMQCLVERLGTFLAELSSAEIDDQFPFQV